MKIIIAGGNGYLGKVLCRHLSETNEVIILSRGGSRIEGGVRFENWDAVTLGAWTKVLEGADVLINLTGRSVDCRYNEANKKEILESRIASTAILGQAFRSCNRPPGIWINAASATIYRHSEDKQMDEQTGETGSGFSVEVCQAWEKVFFENAVPGVRQVAIRTSIVVGKTGGAIKPLLNLARFGLGGRQGNGRQFFSWIHEDDFARAVQFIIETPVLEGAVNVVSPKPVQNKVLMKEIRRALHIPFGIPLRPCILSLGARMIRTETELILKSRNVIPDKLTRAGFQFTYPTLKEALKEITGKTT